MAGWQSEVPTEATATLYHHLSQVDGQASKIVPFVVADNKLLLNRFRERNGGWTRLADGRMPSLHVSLTLYDILFGFRGEASQKRCDKFGTLGLKSNTGSGKADVLN